MRGYIGGNIIEEGEEVTVPLVLANEGLSFSWVFDPNGLYTLLIYNLDNSYLNYLVINIPGMRLREGDTVAPMTLFKSGHRYLVALYSQESLIDMASSLSRSNFPLDSFISDAGLIEIGMFILNIEGRSKLPSTPFLPGNPLTEREEKYCSCVAKVAAQQTPNCLINKKTGGGCYNPYAVCAKSTHTTSRHCGSSYDWDQMPDDRLIALAYLDKIPVPTPYNRGLMLQNVRAFKARERS